MDFGGRNSENLTPDLESARPIYHKCKFSGKTDNFDYFRLNFTKNQFDGRNFKKLSLDLESAPLRYHACQLLIKTDNFEFFGLNLTKLLGWRVERAGWSWVHGLAIPVIFSWMHLLVWQCHSIFFAQKIWLFETFKGHMFYSFSLPVL